MSAESDKIQEALVDQLSSLEEGLDSKINNIKMLAEIQEAIGRLLGDSGANEAHIRRVLQERYADGELRRETFQLVKSMLDRFVTEKVPTSPMPAHEIQASTGTVASNEIGQTELPTVEESMSSTLVIPKGTISAQQDTADGRLQVGSVLRDRFMLQQRVAGGSMGVVYKAMDRRLAEGGSENPWVAIKILSSHLAVNGHALRALQQEAVKGRCLTHPNIVRFIDLDRDDDLYFLVMEWLEGRTLADILDAPDTNRLDHDRAYEIVRQIGEALEYAHRCGIVHADIKPGNIMILPSGEAKLFDFGVARVRQKTIEADPGFDPGVLGLLTPAYSSMQVLTGETPTPADDVFSLACLLYRLIAGYRVFGPRNAAEAANEGMKPQRPEGVDDEQWRALKKALSYARVTRFESMSDFVDALAGKVESVSETDVTALKPIEITVPAREESDVRERSSNAGRWVAGLTVLAAIAVGVQWQFDVMEKLLDRFAIENSIETGPEPADVRPAQVPRDNLHEISDLSSKDSPAVPVQTDESGAQEDIPSDGIFADTANESVDHERVEPVESLVDFSKLPPATAELRLRTEGFEENSVDVRLRENGQPVTIDIVRESVDYPLILRIEEVRFSGNRSPWASGQFQFSDDGFVEFPAGQERVRVTLSMKPDSVREADQETTLRVREADSATSELAIINATLEDDDQRVFEATLPPNAVGFATSQISVREQDPAVQIDILRFNPDNTPLVVSYQLRDITATQGQDYFVPGNFSIEFGPGQRSARLLIPLVQDSIYEDNEAFSIQLSTADTLADSEIHYRTAVLIRDDDT